MTSSSLALRTEAPRRVLDGFGRAVNGACRHVAPTSLDELALVIEAAKREGLSVGFRGSGRSYGDASMNTRGLVVDTTGMNRLFNPSLYAAESEGWNVEKFVNVAAATGPHSVDETLAFDSWGYAAGIVGGLPPTDTVDEAIVLLDKQMAAAGFRGVRPMGQSAEALPAPEVLRALAERSLVFDLMARTEQLAPTAEVLDSRVFVEDGEVCTSAGITAGIDLALHLIAKLGSPRLAVAVAREMAVYMRRAAGDPALSPWLEGRNHMNTAIHRVQDALLKAPAQDWPLARLADIGHLSVRSLTRHFREASGMSVNRYHARLRVALARQALANGDNVERAAERAGLGSARQLRRLWAAHADDLPSSVRQRG